ncbi:MAG: hypothetical protein KJ622_08215 [Alphaproteobacteria bacterium]|nr:hypothetical protein [Alphaproteobacteria bacterium]
MRGQGIGLVNIGSDRHVVASNIKEASPFTKDDAEKLAGDKGYTLNQTFRSRIQTTAGALLSSATPEQVMSRRAKALEANGPKWRPSATLSRDPAPLPSAPLPSEPDFFCHLGYPQPADTERLDRGGQPLPNSGSGDAVEMGHFRSLQLVTFQPAAKRNLE